MKLYVIDGARAGHTPTSKFKSSTWVPHSDRPWRLAVTRTALEAASAEVQTETFPPPDTVDEVIEVHERGYLDYLAGADDLDPGTEFLASAFVAHRAQDTFTPLLNSTNRSAWAAAAAAVEGARRLRATETGEEVLALTRPPGHHALRGAMGGYCYLNNAAVAAQHLSRLAQVAVLDIDAHHGNGTQAIFYDRGDVAVASLHASTAHAYPYTGGSEDETGTGPGRNAHLNISFAHHTNGPAYADRLGDALDFLGSHHPEFLVVSLGFDTHHTDTEAASIIQLDTDDYAEIASTVRRLGVPTLYVLEGGYTPEAIQDGIAGVLG